jgi:hypothetical protein
MTTTPGEETNETEYEVIAKACRFMSEWISKKDDVSADEQRGVNAYLRAKKSFLGKVTTVVVMVFAHTPNEDVKAVE